MTTKIRITNMDPRDAAVIRVELRTAKGDAAGARPVDLRGGESTDMEVRLADLKVDVIELMAATSPYPEVSPETFGLYSGPYAEPAKEVPFQDSPSFSTSAPAINRTYNEGEIK